MHEDALHQTTSTLMLIDVAGNFIWSGYLDHLRMEHIHLSSVKML